MRGPADAYRVLVVVTAENSRPLRTQVEVAVGPEIVVRFRRPTVDADPLHDPGRKTRVATDRTNSVGSRAR